ncbi:MAG: peptidoglycan editing factor PgeF [Gammaproteobacteria bacterium]|nr:peptidoglycan editing factor PgeF [Gammaproteobacteria bacterium]MCI0590630.1 peptidoglycan editing factor PgeF [Gammaproteobacteria bacterium]
MPQGPSNVGWIEADWPAPSWIHAVTTTRDGGVSAPPFAGLNLAEEVGDRPEAVAYNRSLLKDCLRLPSEPNWLKQQHGTRVIEIPDAGKNREVDGACTEQDGVICAVLTADCLPLLLCDRQGTRVAAVHAGWRGLSAGVIEAALALLQRPANEVLAWLGPAIGPQKYEVGPEVRDAFLESTNSASKAFASHSPGHWLADLYGLARGQLRERGITKIYGGNYCTFSDPDNFFSHRRDGATGRMATLIWIESSA